MASLNTGTAFPSSLSLAGNNQFNLGQTIEAPERGAGADGPQRDLPAERLHGRGTPIDDARKAAFNSLRTFDTGVPLVKATSDITQQGLDIQASLSRRIRSSDTFPTTGLGNQLKQVAKIIKLNQTSR